jgi:predicted phage terminase large subunit-like protein
LNTADPELRTRAIDLRREFDRRRLRASFLGPGGLLRFVKHFWHVLEPQTVFVDGWPVHATCDHLQAVTDGRITKLLVNVPPGFMKSLQVDVFWPAWEWGPCGLSHIRYVAFSYSADITERDNDKFGVLITSPEYQELYGSTVKVAKLGMKIVSNSNTGFKRASSVSGLGTGERGDRIILDDPHNIKEGDSEVIRTETVRWFRESMQNRLNKMSTGAIIVIMQRVHGDDVSGAILSVGMDYEHLMIPMEYDYDRQTDDNGDPIRTCIGWYDPRYDEGDADQINGMSAWPDRFSEDDLEKIKRDMGPYAWAGQYQQSPSPRGGGIFKREWWQLWESADGKFPVFDYVMASLDSAFTEQERNDPSALTIWGIFQNAEGLNRAMLVHAWRKHLEFSGPRSPMLPNESKGQWVVRTQGKWGLMEWTKYTCERFKVDNLLIEAKASGMSAAQELQNRYGRLDFGVQLCPVKGSKEARAYAAQPTFSQLLVFAPARDWAEDVISEMESFPKHKYDDLCFAAGTMIATSRGNIPIEQIAYGDLVVTPFGLRQVLAAGTTGWREVIRRHGLTATANHPIFTFDRGFVRIDSTTQASHLSRLSLCGMMKAMRRIRLNSMASFSREWEEVDDITFLQRLERIGRKLLDCMSPFGNTKMEDVFHQAMKFIIETMTPSISILTTWSVYRAACIGQCLKRMALSARNKFLQKLDLWRQLGMDQKRGWNGTECTPERASESLGLSTTYIRFVGQAPALFAGWSLLNGAIVEYSAPACARALTPTSKRKSDAALPVYNLTVDEVNCYYANGILVHNCDSSTQAIKYMRDAGLLNTEEEHHAMEREEAAEWLRRHKKGSVASGYFE